MKQRIGTPPYYRRFWTNERKNRYTAILQKFLNKWKKE